MDLAAPGLPMIDEEGALLQRAIGGDHAAEVEAGARALAGSLRCQRALLGVLGEHFNSGRIAVRDYLEGAEPLARMAAESNDPFELRRWAAVLDLKALEHRRSGARNAEITAHAESVMILNRLADAGDNEALGILAAISRDVDVAALQVAALGLKAMSPLVRPPRPAPSPAPLSVLPEPWALDWSEPSRRERLGWWLSDRWWRVRFWFEDRAWSARLLWWRVQDWFENRRDEG